MALELKANSQHLAPNVSTTLSGFAGVEPYVFSMVPGGIGGIVNAATGKYTAPQGFGIDTVRVTDDVAATFDLEMNVLSPLELLAQIIQQEMGLPTDRVWIFNQKINEPEDQDIYIVLQVLSAKIFSNVRETKVNGAGLDEVQSSNWQSQIQIDIKSRGLDALRRKEEVVMALGSQYAQQQQELSSFRIGKVPPNMVNLSELDGSAIPYRFNITVNLLYGVTKSKAVEYFDNFPGINIDIDL